MSKNSQNPDDTKEENSAPTGGSRNEDKIAAKKAENDKKLQKHIDELRESYKKIKSLHLVKN